MQLYTIEKNGDNFAGVTAKIFTDYTAEFLLTRGPYAMLGYSWCGCSTSRHHPLSLGAHLCTSLAPMRDY
jgi:hypothetical protein